MKKIALLTILLLLVLLVLPVNAATICGNMTFSTLGQGGAEDILIYTFDGTNQTLQGQYNTSSPDVPSYCGDTNVVIRPSAQSRFLNPETMLTDGFTFVETWWIQLGVIMMLIAFFWWRR